MEDEHDNRPGRALVFAGVPAVFGALLVGGGLEVAVPPLFALLVSVMGGPAAGITVGKDIADKVFSTIAAMIGGAGIFVATSWSIERREPLAGVELLAPILLGGLPGLGAFFGLRALVPRPLARTVGALAASVVTVTLIAAC